MADKLKFVFSKKGSVLVFIFASLFYLFLFVSVPVFTIVGNDYSFQISTYNSKDWLLLILLAFLSSLTLVLSLHILRFKKICELSPKKTFLSGLLGSVASVFAAILGTAVCASCITPIIFALGLSFSSTIFLLKYNDIISVILIFLNLAIIYYLLAKIKVN